MADGDHLQGDLTDRVERLETGQASIIGKLDQLLAGAVTHPKAQADQERRLDRPSTVEEQVRAELARAEQERTAAQQQEAEKTERQTLAERLAKLEERPPEQPVARRTRVMWGKP